MSNEPSILLVLALADASATVEQVGGKGASLARLASAGLPVPPGFHITTAAYRRFVRDNGLQGQILVAVSAVMADQPATLEEASKQIGGLFTRSVMPDEIAEAIGRAYAELGGGELPVAVRSSATAEDLPELSFCRRLQPHWTRDNHLRTIRRSSPNGAQPGRANAPSRRQWPCRSKVEPAF